MGTIMDRKGFERGPDTSIWSCATTMYLGVGRDQPPNNPSGPWEPWIGPGRIQIHGRIWPGIAINWPAQAFEVRGGPSSRSCKNKAGNSAMVGFRVRMGPLDLRLPSVLSQLRYVWSATP